MCFLSDSQRRWIKTKQATCIAQPGKYTQCIVFICVTDYFSYSGDCATLFQELSLRSGTFASRSVITCWWKCLQERLEIRASSWKGSVRFQSTYIFLSDLWGHRDCWNLTNSSLNRTFEEIPSSCSQQWDIHKHRTLLYKEKIIIYYAKVVQVCISTMTTVYAPKPGTALRTALRQIFSMRR